MRTEPTQNELKQAFDESGCKGDLDSAMRNPAMAIALINTAATIADRAKAHQPKAVVFDFKRRCAGDND